MPYLKLFDEHGEEVRRKEMIAAKIEMATRVILPTYFILFNFIYWIAVSV